MSSQEIRKELQLHGKILDMLNSASSEESIRKMDALYSKTCSGIWASTKTTMRQEYIRREDGTTLRICIVKARNAEPQKGTGLLWIHGGGYATGLPEQCTVFADRLMTDDSAVMILPDYRKSTEAPYPAALEDCWLTLMWMMVNASRLGFRTDQVFVGGESAGAGLAAALCLCARDKKEINIAFQMLLYPMIDDRPTPSNSDNKSPVWNTEKNIAAWKMYKGSDEEADKYCAPARETDYTGLPPAFIIVGDCDPFLDESKTYAENLYNADVPVMCKVYKGCYHAFDMMVPHAVVSKKAAKLEADAFRHAQRKYFRAQPAAD